MQILTLSMKNTGKTLAVLASTVALLAIVAIPTFAAPASQTYQVMTAPNRLLSGMPTQITATIKQGQPGCAYATTISVTGPGGVSAVDNVVVQTQAGGNGHTAVSFPANFTGTANTDTAGTYTVSVSFQCNYLYVTNAASTTFTVTK